MFGNREKLWIAAGCLALAVSIFIPWPCSKSSVQELTWQLDLMKTEQSYNQSMLYLVDSIFGWEEKVDDFSMHDEWMAHNLRANNRLAELSFIIPDFQNRLDECN